MEKFDQTEILKDQGVEHERIPRRLTGIPAKIVTFTAIAFSLFHLYTSGFGLLPNIQQRAVHLGFVVVLAALLFPTRKGKINQPVRIIDWVIMSLGVILTLYTVLSYDRISMGVDSVITWDLICGALFILIILEVSRRSLGLVFPIMTCLFLLYAYFGPYVPGQWGHRGFGVVHLLEELYMTTTGIWGVVVHISATIIAIFVIFGAFLLSTGSGDTVVNLALRTTGRMKGGPAKVAIVASGLFGMVNGNGPANVAATGVFTIPLMKRLGYRKEFAGAVEATASSGGQIMPPIMGASAFIMSELVGIPYIKIAMVGIIPALLYFLGVWMGVHFETKKTGNIKTFDENLPSYRQILAFSKSLPLFAPIIILVYLLIKGYTPTIAAFWSTIATTILYAVFHIRSTADIKKVWRICVEAMGAAGKGIVAIGAVSAAAQIVVAIIDITGFGVKLSEMVMRLGQQTLLSALFFTMIVTIILGMGLPTVAAYVIAAAVTAPILVGLGIPPLAAHMFVFYYTVYSALTPPVCTSVYVGAGIAEANWLKTASIAMRLGIGGLVVPFAFIYGPGLLLGGKLHEIVLNVATATIGIICLAAAGVGYFYSKMNWVQRIILFCAGLSLVDPNLYTDVIGTLVALSIYLYQRFRSKKSARFGYQSP